MSNSLSQIDRSILSFASRVRGFRVRTAYRHSDFKDVGSEEAFRKRIERLCSDGYLASSKLPRGQQIYRLSKKGVEVVAAPPSYSSQPSLNIAAGMLSGSHLALKSEEFIFLSQFELNELLHKLGAGQPPPKTTISLSLRKIAPNDSTGTCEPETHLHALISELRTADELAARAKTVFEKLMQTTLFSELHKAQLFGITICVPTGAFKTAMQSKNLPVGTLVEVVEDLQDLIA
jgi:hypothetical protein